MRRRFKSAAMALGWTFFMSGLALAHHSVAANFDQSKTMEIAGTVKEIAIRNPHSQITLEVPKPGGGVTDFFIEWSDKNALMRRSVPVSLLKVGDKVTVSVMPSRRLSNLGYFRTATLPDGTILRDCGFAAFREGIANGKAGCEEDTR